jgi:hypothetical protein
LNNAQSDVQIGQLLGEYGYDAERLSEGIALLQTADRALEAQVSTAGGWQAATKSLDAAEKKARVAYSALREVARAAYGLNGPVLAALGLNQTTPVRQTHFLTMARALFNNALGSPDIAATLNRFGYTSTRLTDEKGKIDTMDAARHAREAAKGAAQQATVDQAAAMNNLDKWMSAFFRVAKVALRGQEQLLEKLGILARNAKTEAQRQAPAKAAATRRERRNGLTIIAQKEGADKAVA